MEFNFLLMAITALVGLIVNAIWKFNPVAIFGNISFLCWYYRLYELSAKGVKVPESKMT